MKSNILVVGDENWPTDDYCHCLLLNQLDSIGLMVNKDRTLLLHDLNGKWKVVEKVIWREQGGHNANLQHTVLSLIASSSAHCINQVKSILLYSNRFLLNNALRNSGLPIIQSELLIGANAISYYYSPKLPVVLKVGDWHMGYGKCKIKNVECWNDSVDMAVINQTIFSIEPFIKYTRDLRVLLIGEEIFAVERTPSKNQWKANVCPKSSFIVDAPDILSSMTREAARILDMQILGADWVQDCNGEWILLEVNTAPGLEMGGTNCINHVLKLFQ